MQQKVRVGDLVRVKRANGSLSEQRYKVEALGQGFYCEISEWPGVSGKKMKAQGFDTSLIVVDNSGPKALSALLPPLGRIA